MSSNTTDISDRVASIKDQYGSTEQATTDTADVIQGLEQKYGSRIPDNESGFLVATSVEQKSAAAADTQAASLPAEDNTLDPSALPSEYQAALTADEFVIYGRASVEQYDTDDPKTLIEMDAFEGALDRFFESKTAQGVISMDHKDTVVGMPLREYTLDDATTIAVGEDTYEFDAGDTLRTEVKDGSEDGRPELWLAANIDGESELGKRARLRALDGSLDGYSVTVHRNNAEWAAENKRRITDCDLHAVTLASGDDVRNPGSEFGVAEYKARRLGGGRR